MRLRTTGKLKYSTGGENNAIEVLNPRDIAPTLRSVRYLAAPTDELAAHSEITRRHDGNTARTARRGDEALGVRVSIARIAPSLIDLGKGGVHPTLQINFMKFAEIENMYNSFLLLAVRNFPTARERERERDRDRDRAVDKLHSDDSYFLEQKKHHVARWVRVTIHRALAVVVEQQGERMQRRHVRQGVDAGGPTRRQGAKQRERLLARLPPLRRRDAGCLPRSSLGLPTEKRGSDKGYAGTRYKYAIAPTRRALNWRAIFSSCRVHLWDLTSYVNNQTDFQGLTRHVDHSYTLKKNVDALGGDKTCGPFCRYHLEVLAPKPSSSEETPFHCKFFTRIIEFVLGELSASTHSLGSAARRAVDTQLCGYGEARGALALAVYQEDEKRGGRGGVVLDEGLRALSRVGRSPVGQVAAFQGQPRVDTAPTWRPGSIPAPRLPPRFSTSPWCRLLERALFMAPGSRLCRTPREESDIAHVVNRWLLLLPISVHSPRTLNQATTRAADYAVVSQMLVKKIRKEQKELDNSGGGR
ncbi:hypothetical protein PR048_027610 [Dryococelus australis]|uniref:Uncharacterized protein n=1 Tax=Dryococelus australis TaxID=614101 RepID=A0ABQ9GH09_9NEOP|nr:hypothetical protein PR048_027610 [Dryococelus australis]